MDNRNPWDRFNGLGVPGSLNSLLKMTPLNPPVQRHLVNVYTALAAAFAAAAAGSYLELSGITQIVTLQIEYDLCREAR